MWGGIATEASYQLNFNTGFSTTKSDVLIHLTQWQYWWWFWFAFVWSFYYLIMSRIARFRTLKMRPKITTSFRSHGKWGDFLAGILPLIWCMNILVNSNFILRLIEWQNESSLFLVRVRARQWYWVYKFELKNFTDILITPKNLGRNKWQLNTFGDLSVTDDYLHVLQLRAQNKWIKTYWESVISRAGKVKQNHNVVPVELFRSNLENSYNNLKTAFNLKFKLTLSESSEGANLNNFNYLNYYLGKKNSHTNTFSAGDTYLLSDAQLNSFNVLNTNTTEALNVKNKIFYNTINSVSTDKYTSKMSYYSDFIESSRYMKKQQGVLLPMRLIKLNQMWNESNDFTAQDLFRVRFNSGNSNIQAKNLPNDAYLSLIQKRYERKKNIGAITKYVKEDYSPNAKKVRYSGKTILLNNRIFEEYITDSTGFYRMMKKNKKRSDLISVNLSRRILRTKRTLVLPAHTNITLITNSFDIVHAWFIPGLGIKIDCIPGRSTHHTFYIDNVGFYYGQCAEICGRYHHHMPIRVCALPFEHFLVWWHSFGLPKLIYTNNQKKYETYYAFRKYIW
jgi:heme/copper-type cytochrome/quinol oxidase subunit 2